MNNQYKTNNKIIMISHKINYKQKKNIILIKMIKIIQIEIKKIIKIKVNFKIHNKINMIILQIY